MCFENNLHVFGLCTRTCIERGHGRSLGVVGIIYRYSILFVTARLNTLAFLVSILVLCACMQRVPTMFFESTAFVVKGFIQSMLRSD